MALHDDVFAFPDLLGSNRFNTGGGGKLGGNCFWTKRGRIFSYTEGGGEGVNFFHDLLAIIFNK